MPNGDPTPMPADALEAALKSVPAAPLRPQSAECPAMQKFRTALNALYLEVEPSIANDIVDLANATITEAEAYARAVAPQTLESLTPADYVLAAQKVLTYLIANVHIPHVGMALENEVGRIIYRSLEEQPQRAAAPAAPLPPESNKP